MTEFYEDQDVEVRVRASPRDDLGGFQIAWCKANIRNFALWSKHYPERYEVQFPDGSRAVFDANHIRQVFP